MSTDDEPEPRKAVYGHADDGRVERQPKERWEVEKLVTHQAVAEYRRLADEALERARAGHCSPLEYHMFQRRMEPATLAQTSGISRLRLRRHRLNRAAFRRLPERILNRYAEALGLAIDELKTLPPHHSNGDTDAST